MDLLIGTNNEGKVLEISEGLEGLPLKILTPKLLEIGDPPPETGTTFAQNAELKARFYFSQSALPTVADDSGIVVEALANELGLHTRRWGAGPDASDEEWIDFFLKRMKSERNKRAQFLCVLAYFDASSGLRLFEGMCEGTITETLEAPYLPGLPISACFRPDGFDHVFSNLTLEEKNRVSHRGKATEQFRRFLLEKIAP